MGSTGAARATGGNIRPSDTTAPTTVSDGTHTFEVVSSIPDGYIVWNAGLIDGTSYSTRFLKLAKIAEGSKYSVDASSLKAIEMPVEDARALNAGASVISNFTSSAVEKYIARYDKPSAGSTVKWKLNRLKTALPIMKKYGL